MSGPACQYCKYWLAAPVEELVGECRRRAPLPLLEMSSFDLEERLVRNLIMDEPDDRKNILRYADFGARAMRWPVTGHEDWCGDFSSSA